MQHLDKSLCIKSHTLYSVLRSAQKPKNPSNVLILLKNQSSSEKAILMSEANDIAFESLEIINRTKTLLSRKKALLPVR